MTSEPTLVQPREKTERSENKRTETAAEVVKDALSKVLVHYFPAAGRLTVSPEGKLAVDRTGEGAVFVEAEANCNIEDIRVHTTPDPVTLGKLVYNIPGAKNILEIPPLVV
ncbi:hypothetical protein L1987_47479 [Smallanthus sonchifolius]|uniref:Uncharacterized protein n=1 Tax=Smallanthus sonchifolius TaxID=185202 RepID=A0ACB9G3P0_9ASTR|nr:hypothetical protein L1987_47479 [Smallanthus sonchifolius]